MSSRAQRITSGQELPTGRLLEDIAREDPGAVRAAILRVLLATGGAREPAARELGLGDGQLDAWIERLGLAELVAERWPGAEP